ncbi:MAG TPA: ABC transporter permease [Actinomycetota bacterium]|jgi:osmoprotectant transport system permease protein
MALVSIPVAQAPSAWEWIFDHRGKILHLFLQHAQLTVLAVGIGAAISIPLAIFAYRHEATYGPITWVTGLLYTIPSLALFALLIPFTGLSITTAEVGLVSYTLLILIRNTVAGLRGVSSDVKEAATGMGYTRRQLLWKVEMPLALPAIVAGVRIATVSTIGLVTVAALIGRGGLGQLILEGLNIFFTTEVVLGAVLSVAFALIADALLLAAQRGLTPWARLAGQRTG